MKILTAIANYGNGNRQYLNQLVSEYLAMPWHVDIVVLSNIPKDIHPKVEVLVGLPNKNPWSLPFAHRELFARRRSDYDLFIYSEDDTLVRADNIEAFLAAQRCLGPHEIAGFMRTETDAAGTTYVSTVHGSFRWDCNALMHRRGLLFAPFTNEHAACYMVTREQLTNAIKSGGFLVKPHEGRYDMLCTAATDVYTRCGFRRYVCLSEIQNFLLPHLPNKYIGRMGVPLSEVQAQVAALRRLALGQGWRGPLVPIETGGKPTMWTKDLYGAADNDVLHMIPPTTKTALFIGSGWGAAEAALASSGIDVTALPVDPVFGDALRRRGVRTIEATFDEAIDELPTDHFDAILALDVLHMIQEPTRWFERLRGLLRKDGGVLIVSIPHMRDVADPKQIVRRFRSSRNGPQSQPVGVRHVKRWLRGAGLKVYQLVPLTAPRRELVARASLGALRRALAYRFLFAARVTSS